MSNHIRAGAVSRTEDESGAVGVCPQSVESAVLRAFEDASRTSIIPDRTGVDYLRMQAET